MKKVLLALVLLLSFSFASNTKVPAYLVGEYKDVPTVKKNLQQNGFNVIATYKVPGGGTVVLFSDDTLLNEAKKKGRGFIAVLRAYVDDKDRQLRITNPVHFGKAFMQKEYDGNVFTKEQEKIKAAFTGLHGSKDALKSKDLAHYHFMFGMPYYEDMITVGKGNTQELLNKVKHYNGGSAYLFGIKLTDNSYLVGFNLDKNVASFPQKIGMQNALVLSYLVLIEDGKALILHPKYYLALSYPTLSLGQFMKIASTPGQIEDNIKKAFK